MMNDTLDREQIDLLLSLDDGEGEVLAEIVTEFQVSGAELAAQIVAALARKDAEDVRRAAHTLKGASANVGALGLTAICAAMEDDAQAQRVDAAERLLQQLEESFTSACVELEALTRDE